METKEFEFKGLAMNGFVALFVELVIIALSVWGFVSFANGQLDTPILSVIGLLLAYLTVRQLYKDQHIKDELFDPLFVYCFLGILIGARLGHCLFYEPEVWLSSWQRMVEIVVPIRIAADGSWQFTGYSGLASHGGTLGLMIALWLYYRRTHVGLWTVLDNIAIATGITACFIRLGNLMNSEIVGKMTDVPWAFIFAMGEPSIAHEPRHPAQLYEAVAYLLLFFLMLALYSRERGAWREGQGAGSPATRVGTGFYFGLCLTYIFTFRFFIEYVKEIQVAKEAALTFNIGQQLSIPFIVIGVACMVRGKRKGAKGEKQEAREKEQEEKS